MTEARTFTARDPIRASLLDDHEVVRRGLSDLLDAEPDISVVADAENVAHAWCGAPAVRPHVAVLDVRLPDGDGITVCRELRDRIPELAEPMLTSFDDANALLDAIMAGASGYVLKQIKGSDLVSAVRTVASGQSMLDPATTARLMRSLRAEPAQASEIAPELASLSPRERAMHARARGRAHQPPDAPDAVYVC
ncbi:response regulator transcription factor [Streptomyces mirabilis]|uniref:response regulator n=1 Tax=Streptomyces mirabilis TaxID=68239 RepID=UPI00368401AE